MPSVPGLRRIHCVFGMPPPATLGRLDGNAAGHLLHELGLTVDKLLRLCFTSRARRKTPARIVGGTWRFGHLSFEG